MSNPSQYWNLVKLHASGQVRLEELPSARAFLQQVLTAPALDPTDHPTIQRLLVQHLRDPAIAVSDRALAELCLRCFISHQIEQSCIQLEMQFGGYYGFTRQDLLPFVLDDDGRSIRRQETGDHTAATASPPAYIPLSIQILQKFDPTLASLTTWTLRLVKQHRELNAFLLQQGLCMLSDWAILNDTQPKQLHRILTQFHHLSEVEAQQASLLLQSYHAVYRRDRLLQGQKGPCTEPSASQLLEITQMMQQQTPQVLLPSVLLARLHVLADRLRQYRIAIKRGIPSGRSLDDPGQESLREQLPGQPAEASEEDGQVRFLQTYRQQFLECLEQALEQGIGDRLKRLKSPKDKTFLTAMRLFHCKGLPMADIAPAVGLKAQYQVSRLLDLKAFRADVRRCMVQALHSQVVAQAQAYVEMDQLIRLDAQIEAALAEQVDTLLQEDAAIAKTPKSYQIASVFARRVCQYLDQHGDRLLTEVNHKQSTTNA